jgi:molecular chaperone HtpG
VLLLSDRVDEWLMSHMADFDGKSLQDVAKGSLDLGDIEDEADKTAQAEQEEQFKGLVERVQKLLEEEVDSVRITQRLTDSPACLVVAEHDMGAQMRRIMEAAGQAMPTTKPTLELNPQHPLVSKLDQEADEDRFADLTRVMFDQSVLAEGGQLQDPAAYVSRLNKLLLELSA